MLTVLLPRLNEGQRTQTLQYTSEKDINATCVYDYNQAHVWSPYIERLRNFLLKVKILRCTYCFFYEHQFSRSNSFGNFSIESCMNFSCLHLLPFLCLSQFLCQASKNVFLHLTFFLSFFTSFSVCSESLKADSLPSIPPQGQSISSVIPLSCVYIVTLATTNSNATLCPIFLHTAQHLHESYSVKVICVWMLCCLWTSNKFNQHLFGQVSYLLNFCVCWMLSLFAESAEGIGIVGDDAEVSC